MEEEGGEDVRLEILQEYCLKTMKVVRSCDMCGGMLLSDIATTVAEWCQMSKNERESHLRVSVCCGYGMVIRNR